jgi:hypothetical protein
MQQEYRLRYVGVNPNYRLVTSVFSIRSRARLAAVQKDGTASGFMLIANRAAQALGQS